MGRVEVPTNPFVRCMAFVDDLDAAPNSADVEVRLGITAEGAAAVAISIDGRLHAFTADEARKVADVLEGAGNKFPEAANGYANTIMALRFAADKSEKAHG